MIIQKALLLLRVILLVSLLDNVISQGATKSPCPKRFPVFEAHHNKPAHGDVCRQQEGGQYRCPKGCYKSRMGKPPFCQKRKWNKKPCRSEYKPPPCLRPKYPNFVSYQGIANHGDICRHNNGQYYQCPTGCFKTRNGRRPFCQKAKWIKQPCRFESLQEIGNYIKCFPLYFCDKNMFFKRTFSNKRIHF